MLEFKLHQRVNTPIGQGTIIGFESEVLKPRPSVIATKGFYPDKNHNVRYELTTVEEDSGGRILVRLDNPKKWLGLSEENPHPFMFRHEVSPIND